MTPEITRVLDAYASLVADAASLVTPLTDAQVNFQPDGGTRWSIGQNLDHLVRSNDSYLAAMRPAVDRARASGKAGQGQLTPTAVGRWFVSWLEPPPSMRGKAPTKIQPGTTFVAADVLRAFQRSMRDAQELLVGAAALDLNRARFRNPLAPILRERVSTGFLVIGAHGRRHLWQARQVLAADGFPR